MDGHRLQPILACLPQWFRNYAALHIDTLPKLINHLLVLMACCNFMLFLAAWRVSMLPFMGMNTPLVSFLLCSQNMCLWAIFNNSQIEGVRFLAPTEFMVGNSLGLAVGSTLLAMVLSNYFRNISNCDPRGGYILEYICSDPRTRASSRSVSFWSGLIFWLEFCISLLIAIGRNDLIARNNYEDLSTDDMGGNNPENFSTYAQQRFAESLPQQQQQGQPQEQQSTMNSMIGTFADALPANPFVGNYTSVPEIHTRGGTSNEQSSSSVSSSSRPTTHTPLGDV